MSPEWALLAKIGVGVLMLILGALVNRAFESRPRLITYYGHVSTFTITTPTGPMAVNTHSVVVRNTGRRPATDVRLGHGFLPDVTIYPSREYTTINLPGGSVDLVISVLIPGEQLTVSYLYFPPRTFNEVNLYVKSNEGFAKVITVLPTAQYPRWVLRSLWVLVLLGAITVIYLVVELVRWLFTI